MVALRRHKVCCHGFRQNIRDRSKNCRTRPAGDTHRKLWSPALHNVFVVSFLPPPVVRPPQRSNIKMSGEETRANQTHEARWPETHDAVKPAVWTGCQACLYIRTQAAAQYKIDLCSLEAARRSDDRAWSQWCTLRWGGFLILIGLLRSKGEDSDTGTWQTRELQQASHSVQRNHAFMSEVINLIKLMFNRGSAGRTTLTNLSAAHES